MMLLGLLNKPAQTVLMWIEASTEPLSCIWRLHGLNENLLVVTQGPGCSLQLARLKVTYLSLFQRFVRRDAKSNCLQSGGHKYTKLGLETCFIAVKCQVWGSCCKVKIVQIKSVMCPFNIKDATLSLLDRVNLSQIHIHNQRVCLNDE